MELFQETDLTKIIAHQKSGAHNDFFKTKLYCTLMNEFANVHGAQANGAIVRASQPIADDSL